MKTVRDSCKLQPNALSIELIEDTHRGWRGAIFLALSDGEIPPDGRKRRRSVESDLFSLPLFGSSQGLTKT
jgi:hypothetical protein